MHQSDLEPSEPPARKPHYVIDRQRVSEWAMAWRRFRDMAHCLSPQDRQYAEIRIWIADQQQGSPAPTDSSVDCVGSV